MSNFKDFDEVYEEIKVNNQIEMNEIYDAAKLESKVKKIILIVSIMVLDILILFAKFDALKEYIINLQAGSNNFFPITNFLSVIFVIDMSVYFLVILFLNKNTSDYRLSFKKILIKGIVSYFFESASYKMYALWDRNVYNLAGYFEDYDKFYADDYVDGILNDKNHITISNVITQKEINNTFSDTKTYETVFSGMFAKISISKSIETQLKIGNIGSFINIHRLKMDSQEFEKYFDVSCENKIVGMQILTSDVMEKLLKFYKDTCIKYDITIDNDIIYLRFHCGKMCEVNNLRGGAIPRKELKRYYDILKFICELSTEIIDTINNVEL